MIELGMARAGASWERAARARTRTAIQRTGPSLAGLLERDAHLSDTSAFVADFLGEALGFDRHDDLATEHAGYGVRVDRRLVALVEVKRCTQVLDMRHLHQVQLYAAGAGVEWVVLTNGRVWQVYHLTGRLPLIVDLALEVDLLGDVPLARKVDGLFHLTKEALERRLLDELWRETTIAPQ